MMEAATYVTIALFMAGVIYHAGYLAARVAALELWRAEMKADFADIRHSLTELVTMAKNRRRE